MFAFVTDVIIFSLHACLRSLHMWLYSHCMHVCVCYRCDYILTACMFAFVTDVIVFSLHACLRSLQMWLYSHSMHVYVRYRCDYILTSCMFVFVTDVIIFSLHACLRSLQMWLYSHCIACLRSLQMWLYSHFMHVCVRYRCDFILTACMFAFVTDVIIFSLHACLRSIQVWLYSHCKFGLISDYILTISMVVGEHRHVRFTITLWSP